MPESYDLPNTFYQAPFKAGDTSCQGSVEHPCKCKQCIAAKYWDVFIYWEYFIIYSWLGNLHCLVSDEDTCTK